MYEGTDTIIVKHQCFKGLRHMLLAASSALKSLFCHIAQRKAMATTKEPTIHIEEKTFSANLGLIAITV